jgi:small subunit ribosomal protein S6
MPNYECTFIVRQDVPSSQVEGMTDNFAKAIESGEGKVTKREMWGLKTLAYRIKKNRKGHYVHLNIDAPAPAVHEMERQMGLTEELLRYMTIRVETLEEGPSVMAQQRTERTDRPDRGGRGDRDRGDRGDRGDRDRGDRDRGDRGDRGRPERTQPAN